MLIGNEKQELKDKLEKYLTNNPTDAPEFLSVISNALETYKEQIHKQRSALSQDALNHLYGYVLDSDRFKKLNDDGHHVTSMIDAMFVSFPEGKPTTHSNIEKNAFKFFQQMCINLDMLNTENEESKRWGEWLQRIKGHEYFNWMKKVMAYKFNDSEE